jgi:murein L,D-transpeptidase YcbB/YkuD
MMSFKKAGALVLALASGVAFADVRPASAANLLDILFPKRQRSQEIVDQRTLPGVTKVSAGSQRASSGGFAGLDSDPEALPRVKGPSYYTYKAEAMRPVAIARGADPVVTSAVATASATPLVPAAAVEPQRQFLSDAKVRATDPVAKAVEAWYGENKPLIWVTGSQMNDRARSVLKTLSQADLVGLDPSDYRVNVPPLNYDAADPAARDRALMQFELELSVKALTYAQDAIRGRIDPNRISGYHDFKRKPVDLSSTLKLLSLSPNAGAYLASRSPSNPQFAALKAELERLRMEEAGEGDVVRINLTGLLRPGQSNPELANIVAGIRKRGSEALLATHAATLRDYMNTPDYAPDLVKLVEDFQKEKGLKPDGVIGQATVSRIVGVSASAKIDKLVVAMEQLRWLPADLGQRYVFINQPAFMAYYADGGREQLSMRVVVGGRNTQTYFFNDEIETVELHPYWGVPGSIIINEMLPKLRADPSYLDRLGYEVTYNGQRVSSTEIAWADTSKIGVRQPPGSDNALGELKILFPNTHSIYMHDTPQKSFFKKDMRALSHGCIRLADPRAMAAAVLGTSVDDIANRLAKPGNKAISVPGKVPVYVSYFTAWPDKNGVVQYYDDVYGRDAYTAKAFGVTSKARGV